MARTKASVGAKVSTGKSSKARCSAAPPPSSSSSSGGGERSTRSHGGGNPVCPRETPKWQRPITNFFIGKDTSQRSDEDEDSAGSSKPKKRNIIESDDEDTPQIEASTDADTPSEATTGEPAKNNVLDETIELEPLNGEDSHKIEEYYPKNGVKGKGKGKKTNKENIDTSNERRKSMKRDLEDVNFDEEQVSKKIKVN
ncbi:PCNA-associated factor-like isoform X2 [Pectinophora gossypiella]|uniref:PCNA-associated factor-like isoform X2 n=1 Tax=Pectinophora gossypiella TaxID=13191 RepID=UPI00214EE8DE|nr:PCNA-associated factor-like isoform X2 [Pectinophora gossypiella]